MNAETPAVEAAEAQGAGTDAAPAAAPAVTHRMSPWTKAALAAVVVLGVGGTWVGEELSGSTPSPAVQTGQPPAQAQVQLPRQPDAAVQAWLQAGGQTRVNQFFDGLHDLSVDMYRSATANHMTSPMDLTNVVADARRMRAQNALDLSATAGTPIPDSADERLWTSALTSIPDLAGYPRL